MSIIDIHTGTTITPTYTCGDRITRGGRTYLLLAINEADGWWALNVTDNTFEAIAPTAQDVPAERLDQVTVVTEVVHGIAALQRQCREAESIARSSAHMVEQIRDYAIERQVNGEICRNGLDDFLSHFDLDPVEDTFSFDVVINARASITAETSDSAITRIRYLIDGVAYSGHEDSDDFHVSLQGVDVTPN